MKNQLSISSIILLLTSISSVAQTFQKTIGSTEADYAMAVVQTTDGGYATCGTSYSFGSNNSQIYLVKTDGNGDTLWTHTYDFGSLDFGYAMQLTSDGGFIIAGRTFTDLVTYDDVLLMKLSADGEFEWAKAYGGIEQDHANAVQQTDDGGYIIAGYTVSYGEGLPDIYLLKTDTEGDIEWTKTYGGNVTDEAYSVWQNTDGGYILAGGVRSNLPDYQAHIMRTNASGDIVWSKSVSGSDGSGFYSVQQTADGGFIAAGTTSIGLNYDLLLSKFDASGENIWSKQIGGGGDNFCYQVKQAADGGYALAGYYVVMAMGADAYLVRTDENGDTLWTKTYGGSADDQAKGFTFTNDGGYMLCGHTSSSGFGNVDFYNVKTDANGESNCNEFHPDVVIPAHSLTYSEWTPEISTGGTAIDLTPVESGGGFVQTACTSVEVENVYMENDLIIAYPNPSNDIMNIKWNNQSLAGSQIVLHNNLGQSIMQIKVQDVTPSLNLSSFSNGVYTLSIINSGDVIRRVLVVKN